MRMMLPIPDQSLLWVLYLGRKYDDNVGVESGGLPVSLFEVQHPMVLRLFFWVIVIN